MDKIAIIVAAGSGTRMQSDLPKQFLPLAGKAILLHTTAAFIEAFSDIKIIWVLPSDQIAYGRQLLQEQTYQSQVTVTAGGNSRFQSVGNGLALVTEDSIVFVHDGVRCLVDPSLIQRCYHAALQNGSAIPVCPATDSMRMMITEEGEKQLSKAIDRTAVRLVQTPQTFKSSLLKQAFGQPYQTGFTDEASVLEAMGEQVFLVEGDPENLKITRPIDLIVAEAIINKRARASGSSSPFE